MEGNKYYTPTIEEFRVGFEYEMKSTFGDGTIKTLRDFHDKKWEKHIYSAGYGPYVERSMNGRNPYEHPCPFRVKYLDQDDIKSLGWEPQGVIYYDSDGGDIVNGFGIDIDGKVSYILHSLSNGGYAIYKQVVYDVITGNWSQHDLFVGEIKNKSELQVVMRQIGITPTK